MPTFLFSRRKIQEQLDRLDSALSPSKLDELIGRLNHVNDQRLSAMWEAVFLAALSQETPFSHENALPGGKRPDFSFSLGCGLATVPVVGDITSVTDSGLDQVNPVGRFRDEVFRLAEKHGLDPNHINIAVGGRRSGEWPNQRVKLDLPHGKSLIALLSNVVTPFLKRLDRSDQVSRKLEHQCEEARFTIQYVPGQWASGGSHISYDVILSLTENHIYRRLRRKAGQLEKAPPDALRMVVLCDCGCVAMSSSGAASGHSAAKIAEEFLRRTESVDLVLLVTVEDRDPLGRNSRNLELVCSLVPPPKHKWSVRLTEERYRCLHAFLGRVVDRIPKPIQDIHNAKLRAREDEFGSGTHGGCTMSELKVTISARAVQELLAGTRTHEDFERLHRWHGGDKQTESLEELTLWPNPFADHLKHGRLITSVKATDSGESDDNALEFTFGPPDPAASRFRRRSA